ncbi:MAG: hypothetical protein QME57_00045 [Patescibacteria group bacterium]|nr:hypothetical protein [Patescibacteria group bacterium]
MVQTLLAILIEILTEFLFWQEFSFWAKRIQKRDINQNLGYYCLCFDSFRSTILFLIVDFSMGFLEKTNLQQKVFGFLPRPEHQVIPSGFNRAILLFFAKVALLQTLAPTARWKLSLELAQRK